MTVFIGIAENIPQQSSTQESQSCFFLFQRKLAFKSASDKGRLTPIQVNPKKVVPIQRKLDIILFIYFFYPRSRNKTLGSV